jgi:hypothetical protein
MADMRRAIGVGYRGRDVKTGALGHILEILRLQVAKLENGARKEKAFCTSRALKPREGSNLANRKMTACLPRELITAQIGGRIMLDPPTAPRMVMKQLNGRSKHIDSNK